MNAGPDPLGGLGPELVPQHGSREHAAATGRHPPRAPAQPAPAAPATLLLLLVLGAFFVAELAFSPKHDGLDGLLLYRMGSLHAPSIAAGDLWRVGSYAFLHIGLMHFVINGAALWVLMRPLELTYGSATTTGIFAFAALAGGAASALNAHLGGELVLQSAGASGGIFGLFGATFSMWIRARHHLPREEVRAALGSLLGNLVLNLVIAFVAPVDSVAHGGGLFAGALAGMLVPLGALPRRAWQRPAQWLLVGSAFALAACEGAAVARAVHPHQRALAGPGVAALAPFDFPEIAPGIALSPVGMEAQIERTPEPGRGEGPSVRVGGRDFTVLEEPPRPPVLAERALETAEGAGTLRVTVSCARTECVGRVAPVAEQIARTIHAAQ